MLVDREKGARLMFTNTMPRYEVLSADAMDKLRPAGGGS